MATRDNRTLDLFEWEPPIIEHVETDVRSASFRGRLSRAISATLKECGIDRAAVTEAMTALLGAPVTEHVLNRAASESSEEHMLNPERLWALCRVTNDWRPIAVFLEGSDKVIIDKIFLGAVREAMATAEIERLEKVKRAARMQWRRGR